MELHNQVILVTGGSLGIGKTTAELLAKDGARLIITGRDEERLEKAAKEIGAFSVKADMANETDIFKIRDAVLNEFGQLDCLINNAGIGVFNHLDHVSWQDFESVFRVNVFGAAILTSIFVPQFKKQKSGNIINIGSTAGMKGFERGTIYAASKFALRGMTQCWQAELRKFNVRVFLVNPSEVATAFGSTSRQERTASQNKLRSQEIAHVIKNMLLMDDRGFVPELAVWATNPWD
jgi:3-oxoacyl-[acyl-carrier protein] reductase